MKLKNAAMLGSRIVQINSVPNIIRDDQQNGFFSRIGRLPTFFIAVTAFLVSGVSAAFVPDYWAHVLLRLVTGASGVGFMTTAFVIRTLLIPKYCSLYQYN